MPRQGRYGNGIVGALAPVSGQVSQGCDLADLQPGMWIEVTVDGFAAESAWQIEVLTVDRTHVVHPADRWITALYQRQSFRMLLRANTKEPPS